MDGISGISDSGGEELGEDNDIEAEDIIQRLREADDKESVLEALGSEDGLDGIRTLLESPDIRTLESREALEEQLSEQAEEAVQDEIDELLQVEDQVQLLRNIAANLSVENQRSADIISELRQLRTINVESERLYFKDTNTFNISEANKSQDLLDEDGIVTKHILIKTPAENDGSLFIGNESVTVGSGYPIEAGSTEKIPVDASKQTLEVVSEEDDETYSYIALGSDV